MKLPFADTEVELQGNGLLWFPLHKILCASDIHLEKGSFFQRFATLLPPYDTQATLAMLKNAIEHLKPDIFISLGDGFHDIHSMARMHRQDQETLHGLIASVKEWIWVEGNHDPVIAQGLGGMAQDVYHSHGITFRHEADPADKHWEISGHYHPKARISLRGHSMRLPCFTIAGKRLLMPAFGSYTGGLDVTHPAISVFMPLQDRILYLVHDGQVIQWRERDKHGTR